MFAHIALLSLVTLPGRVPVPGPVSFHFYRPHVEVWTNRGDDPYTGGQAARVYFRTEQDAFVTVFRVDTDGRVRVLFPREPWEDNFARGGREYEVQGNHHRDAFYVDDYPGVGYVFAVAAADPFIYDAIESGDHWDYRVIVDGRVRGDPYVALTDLARRVVPEGYIDWDYDIVPYYVQQQYDYPRFLCYDCHTYVSYPYWSPYDDTCIRFRVVVFDDPYYYPYRYYGGTTVVFTRPFRPEPRFIFKDRQGADQFITRVRQRPVNDDRRRELGVRARDLGGMGTVPVPLIPRERPVAPTQPHEDNGRWVRRQARPERHEVPGRRDMPRTLDRPERRDRPDHPDRSDQDARPDPQRPEMRLPQGRPSEAGDARRRPEPPAFVQPERHRAQPRGEPQAQPRVPPQAQPRIQPQTPPRSEPRAEPKREAPRDKPRSEPELRRRKP